MANNAWLSIMGVYEYDDTIFDGMELPDGIDRNLVINNILMECAELELLIAEPFFLKRAIRFWSLASFNVFKKLNETTKFNYNPIWNKDGVIEETETRDLLNTRNLKNEHRGDNKYDKAAYDETDYQNVDRERFNEDYNDTGTLKDTGTVKRSRTEKGNIGITTTQQMIKEEREIDTFNIYEYITRSFKERFCILVY